jgi:hypothetical protein
MPEIRNLVAFAYHLVLDSILEIIGIVNRNSLARFARGEVEPIVRVSRGGVSDLVVPVVDVGGIIPFAGID